MHKVLFGMFVAGLFVVSPVFGQDNSDDQRPVSRQEFDQLKKDNAEMKKELADVKKQQTETSTNSQQDSQDYDKAIKALQDEIDKARPGLEGVVIAGDAAFGFETQRKANSSFFADVSPLILWQPPDSHLLIESAFDLGIDGTDVGSETTTVTL